MAFKTTVLNESIRNFILVLIVLPLVAASNIDCNGKAFHCVNSTHFMICVDLGGGVSSTIDNFIIPCPSSTECQKTNHFECEFPRSTTSPPIIETSVPSELGRSEFSTVGDSSFISTTTEGVISDVEPTDRTWNTVSITTLKEDSFIANNTVTELVIIENTTTSDQNVGYTYTTVPDEITTNTNTIESSSTPSDTGFIVSETLTPSNTVAMSTFNDVTATTEKFIDITNTDKSLSDNSTGTTTYEPVPNQSATETLLVNDTYDSFTTEKYISTIYESSTVKNNLLIANNTSDNNHNQNTIQEGIDTTVGTTITVANINITDTYAAATETFTEATEITTKTVDKVDTTGLTKTSNGENIIDQNITTTTEITYDIKKTTDDVSHATEIVSQTTIPNNINNNTDVVFTASTVESTTSAVLTAETVDILDQETIRFTFDGLTTSVITTESDIPKNRITLVSVTEPLSTQYIITEINDQNQSPTIGVTSIDITPLNTTQTPVSAYTVANEETSEGKTTLVFVTEPVSTQNMISEIKNENQSPTIGVTSIDITPLIDTQTPVNTYTVPNEEIPEDKTTFLSVTEPVPTQYMISEFNDENQSPTIGVTSIDITPIIATQTPVNTYTVPNEEIPEDKTTIVSLTEPVSTQYMISEINDENQSPTIGVTNIDITPLITTQTPVNTYTVSNEERFTSNDSMAVNTSNTNDATRPEVKEKTKDFTEPDFEKITTVETSTKLSINAEINDNSTPSAIGIDNSITGFTEGVYDGIPPTISSLSGSKINDSMKETIVGETTTETLYIKTGSTVMGVTQYSSKNESEIINVSNFTKENLNPVLITESYKITDSSFTSTNSIDNSVILNDTFTTSSVSDNEIINSVDEPIEASTDSVDIKTRNTVTDSTQNVSKEHTLILNISDSTKESTIAIFATESSKTADNLFIKSNNTTSFIVNNEPSMSLVSGSEFLDSIKETVVGETTTESLDIKTNNTFTDLNQNTVILNEADSTKYSTNPFFVTESYKMTTNSFTTISDDNSVNDTPTMSTVFGSKTIDFVKDTIVDEATTTETQNIKIGSTVSGPIKNASKQVTVILNALDSTKYKTNPVSVTESNEMTEKSFAINNFDQSLVVNDMSTMTPSSGTEIFDSEKETIVGTITTESLDIKTGSNVTDSTQHVTDQNTLLHKNNHLIVSESSTNTQFVTESYKMTNNSFTISSSDNSLSINYLDKTLISNIPNSSLKKYENTNTTDFHQKSSTAAANFEVTTTVDTFISTLDINNLDDYMPEKMETVGTVEPLIPNDLLNDIPDSNKLPEEIIEDFNESPTDSANSDFYKEFPSTTSPVTNEKNQNKFNVNKDKQSLDYSKSNATRYETVKGKEQDSLKYKINTRNVTEVILDNSAMKPLSPSQNQGENVGASTTYKNVAAFDEKFTSTTNDVSLNQAMVTDEKLVPATQTSETNTINNTIVFFTYSQATPYDGALKQSLVLDQKPSQNDEAKETNTDEILLTEAAEIPNDSNLKQPLTYSPISEYPEEIVQNKLENVAVERQTLQKTDKVANTTLTDQPISQNVEAKKTNTVNIISMTNVKEIADGSSLKQLLTNGEELDKTTDLNIGEAVSKPIGDSQLMENISLPSDSPISEFPEENVQNVAVKTVAVARQTFQKMDEVNIITSTESTAKYLIPNANTDPTYHFDNNQKLPEPFCSTRNRGRYADRKDCTKFYICIGKPEPIVGKCPSNTVFSEIKKQCTKNNSHCVRENEFKCLSEGRFSDILKNNAYFICIKRDNHFFRFKFQCQNGFYLNKLTVKCTKQLETINQSSTSVDNSNSEKSVSEGMSQETKKSENKSGEVFECKKEGKFAYPNNCRKFYVCTKTKKSEFRMRRKSCDSDELFHKDKKKCVDADSYEC